MRILLSNIKLACRPVDRLRAPSTPLVMVMDKVYDLYQKLYPYLYLEYEGGAHFFEIPEWPRVTRNRYYRYRVTWNTKSKDKKYRITFKEFLKIYNITPVENEQNQETTKKAKTNSICPMDRDNA